MANPSREESLDTLKTLLREGEVRRALVYLNSLTEHRFSALYRFDRATLRNMYFFDRESPAEETVADIPVMASYCVYVRDTQKTFSTGHAAEDPRTSGHPKRLELQSYCGVPLRDIDGRLFGTLCHFDVEPRDISPENLELAETIARFIKRAPE